jgi:hypothetical protein
VLSRNVSKFLIAYTLGISPDSAPYPIIGVLRDRRQSESESVSRVLPHKRYVPTIITSSLLVRLERMSNDWKVEKAN